MSGWLEVGAACAIVSATTSVSPTETGWSEQVVYDLLSSGGCKTVVLHSEPGVQQAPIVGKLRLGDGSGGKLRSERYRTTSSPSGAGLVSVSLPEMLSGDGVRLTVDRSWPADHSYRWQPHRESAAWSELRTWRGAQITSYGEIEVDRKRGTAWVTAATESDSVELPTALPEAYPRDSSQVVVAESGLSLRAALEKVAPLLLQPRAVDGHELVTGDEALARGIVDDRGWARTLVALTKDGPDRVELGHRMPRNAQAGATRDADAELAVYFDGETVRPLMHPVTPDWRGNVQTDGTLQRMEWDQVAPTQPQSALTLNRELNLGWTGDPQYALVPGAGSWVVTVDSIALPADTAAVRYLPLPSDPEEFSFSDGATWTPTLGGVLISAPRGEAREVQVTYRQEDAPTFGERADVAGFSVDQQVRPQDGKVRWEGTSWRLDSADGLPILPNREALLRALDWRFTILAYPEPALPGLLKGRRASWETATDLPEALRSRVTPGDLDVPPLWPRKLLKARRSGVVSSVEAALFTSQWARAMQIDAVWVLVRPAPRGPGPAISPASYTQGLLAIQYEGELRWQDPTCTVCAPYELRPDMEGASAYAWGLTKTREPTQGLLVATTSGDETTFALEASAALSLRLALQSGMADRSTRAAEWLAENATLTKVDGLGTAGEPVTATVVGGAPAFWPEADPDGSLWMGWVGERRWVGAPTGADALYEGDALTWSRSTSAGVTTETLTIVDRRVPAETLATLREVQSQTTLPEPSVSPEDEAEGAAEGAVEDAPPPATED